MNKDNPNILYVDDEKDNLFAFKAAFRRFYKIITFSTGQEALEYLKTNTVDLLICDQKMPKMTGIEILEKASTLYPNTIRMILTGYSDMQAIIDAINKGKVYNYISKPWDVEQLRILIDKALETQKLRNKNQALSIEKQQLELRTSQLEKENIQAQFEILKNQINPHFLFNCLNILSSLIEIDQEKAVLFTYKFSELYRNLLELKEEKLIYLDEEIDFTKAYVDLQMIRFQGNLIVEYEIDQDCMKMQLPPFTLQFLLENAIKHNVVSLNQPLKIVIQNKSNHIVIRNNLQLREDVPNSTKTGLLNLKNRYQIITSQKLYFDQTETEYIAKVPLVLSDGD